VRSLTTVKLQVLTRKYLTRSVLSAILHWVGYLTTEEREHVAKPKCTYSLVRGLYGELERARREYEASDGDEAAVAAYQQWLELIDITAAELGIDQPAVGTDVDEVGDSDEVGGTELPEEAGERPGGSEDSLPATVVRGMVRGVDHVPEQLYSRAGVPRGTGSRAPARVTRLERRLLRG